MANRKSRESELGNQAWHCTKWLWHCNLLSTQTGHHPMEYLHLARGRTCGPHHKELHRCVGTPSPHRCVGWWAQSMLEPPFLPLGEWGSHCGGLLETHTSWGGRCTVTSACVCVYAHVCDWKFWRLVKEECLEICNCLWTFGKTSLWWFTCYIPDIDFEYILLFAG